ncbi:unnamed protein product [Rhodiola kirilowii]
MSPLSKTKHDEEFKETKQGRVDYDKGIQNPPHCWNRCLCALIHILLNCSTQK